MEMKDIADYLTEEKHKSLDTLHENIGRLLDGHGSLDIMNVLSAIVYDVLSQCSEREQDVYLRAFIITVRERLNEDEETVQ